MRLTNNPFHPVDRKQELPLGARRPSVSDTLACKFWAFDYVEKRRARLGGRFTVHPLDMSPLVFLSSPLDIRSIATASPDILHSGGGGALMAPVFGESSFALRDRDEHASVREAITPMFHGPALRGHAGTIAGVVEREIGSWPVDDACSLSPHLDRLTLLVMLKVAIAGPAAGRSERLYETLCQRVLDMLSVMATPLLQEPRLRCLPGWRRRWRRFLRQRDEVDELVYGLISQRRDDCGSGDSLDLVGRLIAARNPDHTPLSDKQVRDNLISTIVAGHETTSATLAWTFQLLAHNPAVQDRLIEEMGGGLDDVGDGWKGIGDGLDGVGDRSNWVDDRPGGAYMNAVIQEALRHKPTFLFLPPRVVLRPTEIGGWSYRPPAQLLGCTYLLHHDPELYVEPHAFTPERFLQGPLQRGTFLPWGLGRKRCPGRQLALMEIREVLRQALSRWRVLPASPRIERPRWRTVVLAPHAGSKVILRPRVLPRLVSSTSGGCPFNSEHSGSI